MRPTDEPKTRATIYMPQRLCDELDAMVEKRNVSRSEMVCELIKIS